MPYLCLFLEKNKNRKNPSKIFCNLIFIGIPLFVVLEPLGDFLNTLNMCFQKQDVIEYKNKIMFLHFWSEKSMADWEKLKAVNRRLLGTQKWKTRTAKNFFRSLNRSFAASKCLLSSHTNKPGQRPPLSTVVFLIKTSPKTKTFRLKKNNISLSPAIVALFSFASK